MEVLGLSIRGNDAAYNPVMLAEKAPQEGGGDQM